MPHVWHFFCVFWPRSRVSWVSFCWRSGLILRALPVDSLSGSLRVAVGRKRGGGISGSSASVCFGVGGAAGGGDEGGEEGKVPCLVVGGGVDKGSILSEESMGERVGDMGSDELSTRRRFAGCSSSLV